MAAISQTVFRQRFCQATDCRTLFFICTHCDRGQRYCSLICRRSCRLQQRRAARRRHQQSMEGRLDHRDRQRAYRLRRAAIARSRITKSVTDHGSNRLVASVTITPPCNQQPELDERAGNDCQKDGSRWLQAMLRAISDLGLVVCSICGRVGRFLNPFHESG
jgi:hypothetical protein